MLEKIFSLISFSLKINGLYRNKKFIILCRPKNLRKCRLAFLKFYWLFSGFSIMKYDEATSGIWDESQIHHSRLDFSMSTLSKGNISIFCSDSGTLITMDMLFKILINNLFQRNHKFNILKIIMLTLKKLVDTFLYLS